MAFDMELRVAQPKDIGQIAYVILRWFGELPSEQRFFPGESWQAERTAELMVYSPKHLTKVLMQGDELIGLSSIIKNNSGVFSPQPYAVIFAVYVKPEYRGHRMIGLKLFKEAIKSAAELGMYRVESNPMYGDRGTAAVLKRMGFNPLCNTYFKELNHG